MSAHIYKLIRLPGHPINAQIYIPQGRYKDEIDVNFQLHKQFSAEGSLFSLVPSATFMVFK